MKEVTLEIDGKVVKAREGETILQAARRAGVEIPTLCYDEELEPYGACRICLVEVERGGRTRTVVSCCYPVEGGLRVRTETPKLRRMRKVILELAAITAGEDVGEEVRSLAHRYGADLSRFSSLGLVEPSKCILCGLCVRTCSAVTQDGVLAFVGRGVRRAVALFPEKTGYCGVCGYCSRACPTGKIPERGPEGAFPSAYEEAEKLSKSHI